MPDTVPGRWKRKRWVCAVCCPPWAWLAEPVPTEPGVSADRPGVIVPICTRCGATVEDAPTEARR